MTLEKDERNQLKQRYIKQKKKQSNFLPVEPS
jgi:hypothetical protein